MWTVTKTTMAMRIRTTTPTWMTTKMPKVKSMTTARLTKTVTMTEKRTLKRTETMTHWMTETL
jgi:hypothetical protein